MRIMKEPKIRFIKSSSFLRKQLKDIAIINPKCSLPEIFEYVDLESVIGTEMKNHRTEKKGSAPSRAQRLAQKGDIFFQTVRPYQQNNYYFDLDANNFVFSTGYAQICSKVNPKYLFTILQQSSFLDQVLENCTGTSYPAIAPSALSNLYLNVCVDPNEQNLIASYFQSLDTLIQATSKQLASLKQIKAASLQSMFPQEGETKPRVRFKGFEEEWMTEKLGSLFLERNESNIYGEMLSVTMNNGIIKAADNGRFDNSNKDKSHYKTLAKYIVYTGAIDEYYDYSLGELEYRSLKFEIEKINKSSYQGNAVINYTEYEVPYTRIIEHKFFDISNEEVLNLPYTIISKEYPKLYKKGDERYYPINDDKNNNLYLKYLDLSKKEENIFFGGRLASYKYYDMDDTIEAAFNLYNNIIEKIK